MSEKYSRCWACDTLINSSRREVHHIFGKDEDNTIELCVCCHDLIDRMKSDDIDVAIEFMKANEELNELPRGKTKYLRLFLLKTAKFMKYSRFLE